MRATVYSRWILSAVIAGLLAIAASLFAGAPASASGSDCDPPETTQAFKSFGDSRWYYLAPGGDFEADSRAWSTYGLLGIVSTSHLFDLLLDADNSSVRMLKDSRITSPKLCVTAEQPHMRFMAKAARGSGQLDVKVRLYNSAGNVTDSSSGSISPSDHSSWKPSRDVGMKTDHLDPGETAYVDVRFQSQGDWMIDDVLIDPYRRG